MVWKKKAKTSNKKRTPKIKAKVERKQLYHNGIPVDSQGEDWFLHWCDELIKAGYINKVERGKSYLLSDALYNNYVQQLKTKSKPKSEVVLYGHSYNLDFEVHWNDKAINIFVNLFGSKWEKFFLAKDYSTGLISYIEAKPTFDFQNMERLATNCIKSLYDKHNIFCQMVKNDNLFKETFVPKTLLKLKNGNNRPWKFKVRTLEEFIKGY